MSNSEQQSTQSKLAGNHKDRLAMQLRADAAAFPTVSPALSRRIHAAVEREAARGPDATSTPRRRSGAFRWLPALASLGAAATVAAVLLIPAKAPVSELTPAASGRLVELVPTTDPETIAAEGRQLEALARQPLEQELAAVDAVISEFGEVMSKDFGALALFAGKKGRKTEDAGQS